MMTTGPSLLILGVAALAALLAAPPAGERRPFAVTLLLLPLGAGALVLHGAAQSILISVAIVVVLALIVRAPDVLPAQRVWGIGTYSMALGASALSFLLDGAGAAVAVLIASAALLPLFPGHGGYVTAVAAAPGTAKVLVAAVLPVLGLHAILSRLTDLPSPVLHAIQVLALTGTAYGSLKALVQARAMPLMTYAGTAFFSMLWWYLAAVAAPTSQAVVYGGAVGLAVGGLLLAWEMLRARYGDVGLDQIGGLARPMPRFGFLFAVLTSAAMGLPPFGVFAGYIGMFLAPGFAPSAGLIVLLLAWLSASWYFLAMLQRVLFGPPRRDLLYDDLRAAEAVSLALVLAALLALGLWPPLVGPEPAGVAWIR